MYPLLRYAYHQRQARRMGPLQPFAQHVVTTRVMPWDIDPFWELNNGRTLTLYDLGRLALYTRLGLEARLAGHGLRPTIAGTVVRYRQRIRLFDRLVMPSRVMGWDARFFYLDHSLWRDGVCCNHSVVRMAFTSGRGIAPTAEIVRIIGWPKVSPPLPAWIEAWSEAEAQRPWPPEAPGNPAPPPAHPPEPNATS